jgi:hypothetical protein
MVSCLSGVPQIFAVRLTAADDTGSEIRVGYYGTCVGDRSGIICHTTFPSTALATFRMTDNALIPLLEMADRLQEQTTFPHMIAASVFFFFVKTILICVEHLFPGRPFLSFLSYPKTICSQVSLLLVSVLASALTYGQLAINLPGLWQSDMTFNTSADFQRLHWAIVAFSVMLIIADDTLSNLSGSSAQAVREQMNAHMAEAGFAAQRPASEMDDTVSLDTMVSYSIEED